MTPILQICPGIDLFKWSTVHAAPLECKMPRRFFSAKRFWAHEKDLRIEYKPEVYVNECG